MENKENKPTTRPVKKNGYSNAKRLARLEKRRVEAQARNGVWVKLSVREKISSLSKRSGKSKKQIAKLEKLSKKYDQNPTTK